MLILLQTEPSDWFVFLSAVYPILKSEEKKRHVRKLSISKKFTYFVQSSWNLVKIITSRDSYFHKVSWWLEKNCGFFINGWFWTYLVFFPRTLQDSEILLCKILLTSIYAVCKRLCFNIILPKNTKFWEC